MSWLRSNPLRTSFSKQRSRDSPPKDADPSACYDSFCKHSQQIYEIILHSLPPKGIPTQDDVLGVVNHIDQMVTLLILELRDSNSHNHYQQGNTATHSPCLEYLLSENLLVKLYDWSIHTGRFNNAVRLEQIKLYELLVSHSGTLLAHETVTRPLLRLLEECSNDVMPLEVEKKLVVLLNQLCVALMQNMALLDLFFHPTASGKNKFIIFNLLIPHIHREGGVGQQARDAMLLCMSLSKKNDEVGLYIADHSNICPVLATGLSGLYSLLPRKLNIETDDWHQLTPDDVNDLPALTQLMNSLEFCNAVAQVAHPMVQKQLLEFLYQGFLIPVIGPALYERACHSSILYYNSLKSVTLNITNVTLRALAYQKLKAVKRKHNCLQYTLMLYSTLFQLYFTTVEELVAATAYFDLFLRSVTDPGLLRSLVKFLLEDNYEDCRILDCLIQRISSRSRLCIVTLALFETLVNLNCEDIMLELCLGALNPCSHVMLSQRSRLRDIDPFGRAAEKFLSLTPRCCSIFTSIDSQTNSLPNVVLSTYDKYGYTTSDSMKSLPASINYGTRLSDSLYGNYHAYLCDARQKIKACRIACSNWSCQYDELLNEDIKITECAEETCLNKKESDSCIEDSTMAMNSLISLGESSGYESFAFKESSESTPDKKTSEDRMSEHEETHIIIKKEIDYVPMHNDAESNSPIIMETSLSKLNKDALYRQDVFNGQPNIGIFLDVVLRKLECMTSNNLYVNLHLTGLISRLAIYSQPLLQSFLLNHSLVFQPSIKSLFQVFIILLYLSNFVGNRMVLASLKHKIDQFLSKHNNVDLLVEQAKIFLINRENKLVNARKNVIEAAAQSSSIKRHSLTGESFSRGEPKRKSLTSSFTQMFRRSSGNLGSGLTNQPSSISEDQLQIIGSGYRYTKTSWESPNEVSPVQNVVLCCVILDEWLKELAAITQEHAIMSTIDGNIFKP
ncbi:hypothetical protein ALC62_01797 [Cyphomyrmex costatus]|uniref:FHF complex subunit HOOK-interacting protein C-terminal domain-containing protein n=1 Tax=Cyphomyrmex costatus TaxID=456900 RepID=A0A151IP43_9HYME|nr:hypothetical protein ALC62_01797 [Cyphomyrmex costatus]